MKIKFYLLILLIFTIITAGCISKDDSVCNKIPEGQISTLCELSEKVKFNLEDIHDVLLDVNQLLMLSKNYDPDKMIAHFKYVYDAIETDGGNVIETSYDWFLDKIFAEADEIKKAIASDMLGRRLSHINVPLPITDFDKELLKFSVQKLIDQVEKYRYLFDKAEDTPQG
jgi:hypothetical protein